jgi:hypothetical protein
MAWKHRKWLIAALGTATAVPLGRYNGGGGTPTTRRPPHVHPNQSPSLVEQQMPGTTGSYLTYVGGYLAGTGTSKVGGGAVILSVAVTTADGVSTTLSAPSLTLTGDHFAGTATAAGCSTLNIVGRLDGYQGDTNFHGARILAYYTDNNGHNGKIGGVIEP